MKITMEIDCTPEEARRAIGLPDVAMMQESYVARLAGLAENGMRPEMLEVLARGWAPLGEAGLGLWRTLMDAAATRPVEGQR